MATSSGGISCGGLTLDQPSPQEVPASSPGSEIAGSPSEKLEAVFKADFAYQLTDNPEFGTQAGFHECDTELQDLSPQAWEARLAHNAEVLDRLESIDMVDKGITATQRLYAELLKAAVESESRAIELGCHVLPINSIGVGGVHENFIELVQWMVFESDEDYKTYLGRLMAFPKQVRGYQDLLAYGGGMLGMPASKSMMRKVPERLQELVEGDLEELSAPLDGKEVDTEVAEQIRQAIEHCFKAALRELKEFVTEFYMDRVREDAGCSALRNGAEVYRECLIFHTTTKKTPQEIHDLGLQEVGRIEARFQHEVLDVLGFGGSFIEFAESLKQDKSFCYSCEEELLNGYRSLVSRSSGMLPKYFSNLPKSPLEVVSKRSGPAAYYFCGTPDGKRPGRFYVNVSRLDERPRYEMPALALHEGIPGHHLQGALAIENSDLPDFLRYIEDRRYEFCPARRPLYTAYLEGWALYCEALGEEMGMYVTPYELFGRLSCEMMRAVRLVVDTGIHAFGWSVERAIKYMEEKTGMAAAECSEEIHRYAAWPGQACGYKIGELAIREMRRAAEAELAGDFDIKAFHNIVLGVGPLPLDILAQRAERWIAAVKAGHPSS